MSLQQDIQHFALVNPPLATDNIAALPKLNFGLTPLLEARQDGGKGKTLLRLF